jgi:hypothetical protein
VLIKTESESHTYPDSKCLQLERFSRAN